MMMLKVLSNRVGSAIGFLLPSQSGWTDRSYRFSLGSAVAIYPGICLLATGSANLEALKEFKETGRGRDLGKLLPAFLEFNEFLGTSRYAELEERHRID
jgi:hypothetical protein